MKAKPFLRTRAVSLAIVMVISACWLLNNPPVIISLTASTQEVGPGGTVTLTCEGMDPNGDLFSYAWTAPDAAGIYTVTVLLTDANGLGSAALKNRSPSQLRQ